MFTEPHSITKPKFPQASVILCWMKKLLRIHWRFLLILLLVAAISFFRFQKGIWQQDNYLGYAQSFPALNKLDPYDLRLFPGFPVLMRGLSLLTRNLPLAGYLVVFLSFLGSYCLLYKMTKSVYSFIPLIFPPIMLSQATLIATEYPAIFFILLGVYLIKSKKFLLSSLVFGFGLWIRVIAAVPFAASATILLREKKFKLFFENAAVFLFPIALLFAYNSIFLGHGNFFRQFGVNANLLPFVVGAIQIFADMERAFRWGWYRILISGSFYFIFLVTLLIWTFSEIKKKKEGFNYQIFVIILTMTAFVFLVTFNPFLENLGRYISPIIPLFWLLLYKRIRSPVSILVLVALSAVAVAI